MDVSRNSVMLIKFDDDDENDDCEEEGLDDVDDDRG